MDTLDLARWQFAIVTVYHFIFVPLTIGLAPLVAIMQTMWVRTGSQAWLKLTKFFGKLLLINFAVGVVTGIVQEFQFGMNWSEYSRFVGDVFGAPLAIEGLAAFFFESTFLGLWIFGWDKLPKKVHLACIWVVAIATNISAYFILAANSWMQHPVGAIYNETTGRAEMTDFGAVMTNNTLLAAFSHTVASALLVGGTFVAGVAGWWIVKSVRSGDRETARTIYRPAAILGMVTIVLAGAGVAITGDWQAKLMYEQQPMKMSAAEALCEGESGAAFSILTIGDLSNSCEGVEHILTVPGLTSYLGTGEFDGYLPGVEDLQTEYEAAYGEGVDYQPNLALTYWSFRLMIGFAIFSGLLAAAGLWLLRKGRVTENRWFARLCLIALPMPFIAASFGWIFTETGRQPWVVVPNPDPTGVDAIRLLTQDGVSTSVVAGEVIAATVTFTVLYTVLAVVWFTLMRRYASGGIAVTSPPSPDSENSDDGNDSPTDAPLSFAY
ncbi:cytochrome ubiquinol oxidase subunit I [Ruania halotolerans]|uniref:cytochrome ubiquinol oxidase subunit I n=1 Tax=Ruania halotolerans TaxID=2897773 RepID=UPI001E2A3C0A|nr:cytochrome ubiquinol oxidase subunit I [Ruania halotolerans]UFU08351.1 cytochrome ubiquinol oxidase subunit I [Ruania halotolerans]